MPWTYQHGKVQHYRRLHRHRSQNRLSRAARSPTGARAPRNVAAVALRATSHTNQGIVRRWRRRGPYPCQWAWAWRVRCAGFHARRASTREPSIPDPQPPWPARWHGSSAGASAKPTGAARPTPCRRATARRPRPAARGPTAAMRGHRTGTSRLCHCRRPKHWSSCRNHRSCRHHRTGRCRRRIGRRAPRAWRIGRFP